MSKMTPTEFISLLYTQVKETETKIYAVRWACDNLYIPGDASQTNLTRDKVLLALYELMDSQFKTLLANVFLLNDEEREKAKVIVKQRYMSSVSSFQDFMLKSGFHAFTDYEDARKAFELIFPRTIP